MKPSTENTILSLLRQVRVIAVVGLSPNPDRASHRVAAYMQGQGYRIIPVRPGMDTILGEKCYPTLEAIPSEITVDLVDVFRRAEETLSLAEAAVQRGGVRGFWLQSGIINDQAMAMATSGGLHAVQDRCLMVEHRYLAEKI